MSKKSEVHNLNFSSEDLEDFISHLFHQAMSTDGTPSTQSWQPPQSNGQTWNSTAQSHPTNTAAGKRQRKKKKKH
jgi:hypothetical protein